MSTHIPRLSVPQLSEQMHLWKQIFGRVNADPKIPQHRKEHAEIPLLLLPKRSLWKALLDLPAAAPDGAIITRLCDATSPLPNTWKPLNYLEEATNWYRLRQGIPDVLKELEEMYPKDGFILVQAVTDDFHLNKSPVHTIGTMRFCEYALDLLSGLAMSMVSIGIHLQHQHHFHLYCPGGQYDPKGANKWSDTPRIDIEYGRVALDWNWESRARDGYRNLTAVRFRKTV